MIKVISAVLALLVISTAFAGGDKKEKKKKKPKLEKGMYAEFNTTKGVILCKLEFEKTPMTVANFVGLAEGDFSVDTTQYTDRFYDGVKFHRVIADFMIQGGDPLGSGAGGPDHRFYDETRKDLTHSGPGILSMANSDPRNSKRPYDNTGMTNGSQFFITHKETPHLDGLHTVFGHVIQGQDVVNAITQGDTILSLNIIRKGKIAKKWNQTEVFAAGMKAAEANIFNLYLSEGKRFIAEKNFTLGKQLLEMAQKLNADNTELDSLLAGIDDLIHADNITKAEEMATNGDLNGALGLYKDAVIYEPDNNKLKIRVRELETLLVRENITKGDELVKGGDFKGAIALYESAIQSEPSNSALITKINETKKLLAQEEALNAAYIEKVSAMKNDDFIKFMYSEVIKDHPKAELSETGLVLLIESEGLGKKASKGDKLSVHYRGSFRRGGKKFDSSYDRGQPMSFTFLQQRMIPGFEEGLQKLGKGGKATIIIPYFQAYGDKGRPGAIPPYSDLVFDLEIVDLVTGEEIEQHEHHPGDGHNH
jgi:cyclophilin family peptidyl-prolyl cis-trans isomerase/FKBP-type peptidyl-prolyl cis-trans isomerase